MAWVRWNAHVHIDGANAQWIGLGWGMADEKSGDPKNYWAEITVTVPAAANAMVGKVGKNEQVTLKNGEDPCGDVGIPIMVTYRVTSKGGEGQLVAIKIAENAGQKSDPTGDVLYEKSDIPIGQAVTVPVLVPGSCDIRALEAEVLRWAKGKMMEEEAKDG